MKNQPEQIAAIFDKIAARNLSHITTAYFDHNGKPRSKYYHIQSLHKALLEGLALNLGIFSVSVNEKQMQNSIFLRAEQEFRDGLLQLDASSCRDLPLGQDHHGLLLIGELVDEYRAYCCRALLAAELQRYNSIGLLPSGAFEIEWYMLRETPASVTEKLPHQILAEPGFETFYSFTDQTADNDLFAAIQTDCEIMGLPVESLHNEFSTLMEAALLPAEGISIADNAALFKALIKTIARKRGLLASFMARRHQQLQGCGAHVNLTLLGADNHTGLFYDAAAADQITDTLLHFIGGLQKYTPELFLLQCPNLNSFRRLQAGLFAPLSNTWGINNKTVAYRVVNTTPSAARIEVRLPGADINPYLSLLGILIAGRLGIEEKLQPAPPVQGDGWSAPSPDGLAWPPDFPAAIAAFDRSAPARKYLGDAFVDCFVSGRQWQLDDLGDTITDWEIHTFIEGV
ncbi:MAG: glutamine synthetase family protein [Gammaproteobacteria bacterium]